MQTGKTDQHHGVSAVVVGDVLRAGRVVEEQLAIGGARPHDERSRLRGGMRRHAGHEAAARLEDLGAGQRWHAGQ